MLNLETLPFEWARLRRIVFSASGIYYREPETANDRDAIFMTSIRAIVSQSTNVIMQSLSSANWSKPLQMSGTIRRLQNEHVLAVDTLITNIVDEGCASAIVKSISSWRSCVVERSDARLGLECYRPRLPMQFQQRVAGQNVRVHVAGLSAIACLIESHQIDYRYDEDAIVRPTVLASDVEQWCIGAARSEGLRFAGIDLIKEEAGIYRCLEINPAPGYDYFERRGFATDSQISRMLANELLARTCAQGAP